MPSSYVDSYPPIVKLLIERQPRRVLDIGPGWGKYGLACREYLTDLETLRAIEVPPGRLPTQDVIYDQVYTCDARKLVTFDLFWQRFDLVLLIDVIEHMPLQDGHTLLHAIQRNGAEALVATPKLWIEQHDDHNPYETHVSWWYWDEFTPHDVLVDVSTIDSIIYLLRAR